MEKYVTHSTGMMMYFFRSSGFGKGGRFPFQLKYLFINTHCLTAYLQEVARWPLEDHDSDSNLDSKPKEFMGPSILIVKTFQA